jgi:hypothetical protein
MPRLELTVLNQADSTPMADVAVHADTGKFSADATTGADGIAAIDLPEMPRHLGVHLNKTGYVPRLLAWDLGAVNQTLPAHYTTKMERGQTIGGLVRNQTSEPVEGANVLVSLRGATPPGAQPREYHDIFELRVPTDAQGRWRYDEACADLQYLRLRLEHPDYISNEHLPTQPPAEEFQNGTAVLTMLKGVPCEGIVTDEQGRPIEKVKVLLGEGGQDSCAVPTRRTDAQGRFRFGAISQKRGHAAPILSFLKQGYAPEMVELPPASALIQRNVRLRKGRSLRVQFRDPAGQPIPGVIMAIEYWRGHRPFHWRFNADETGLFEWADAPDDAVTFAILHESFQRHNAQLTASDEIQTIVLLRPGKISCRVIDARTKEPIPKFRVIYGTYFPERHPIGSNWNTSYPKIFTAGAYVQHTGSPVTIGDGKGGPGESGFRRLRIDADGYQPAVSRPIANEEEQIECDFELEPGAAITGTIRDAEGRPAAGIELIVAGLGNPMMVRNGEPYHRQSITVTADETGRYVLPPQEEDFPIVVAHPKLGYATTTCSELAVTPDLQLRAWGRLEIAATVRAGAKPPYYLQPVMRSQPVILRESAQARIRFDSSPTVTRDGLLVFEGLTAGPWRLAAHGQPMHGGPEIIVENGKTHTLDLRSGRRSIVGQIILPAEGIAAQEPLAQLRLRAIVPQPEIPGALDRQQQGEWWRAWQTTPEGRAHRAASLDLPFEIDHEGKFRIDDLAPGRYNLSALFFRSMPSAPNARPDVIGLAVVEFELAAGEAPLDLGRLDIQPPGDIRTG